jgi:hypothetical protein
MQREFARSYIRLMDVKINDRKGRNHDATPRRILAACRRRRDCRPRYFFVFSILVTVSPDWVAVKLT